MAVAEATTVVQVNGSPRSADEILSLLRAHGDRVTASRRAVVEALVAGGHHVTADEIVARVTAVAGGGDGARDADAHRATVYRTLDRLEELGVVSHVHLGHGPSTFHLDDRPHHHAVCSSCGAVVEVPLDALDGLAARLRDEHGFELSSQHFALSGRCASCR
jgi:Fur family ferric uptake transcriptional regulator